VNPRRVLGHEWTLAGAVALVISLVLNRASLGDLAHTLPQDTWDPSLVAYLIAWGGHALVHQPGDIWQLNAFYPAPYSLAYTDSLLAYAPFAVVGTGPEAAVVRYNLLFIAAQALVLLGGYALARQLGTGRIGAAVAGLALGLAPWRLAQAGHLQILSTGGMFLALAMLARGHGVRWYRRTGEPPPPARPGWALAGWLVAAWQLAIGFGIGLPFVYVLLGCLVVGVAAWALRRRPWPSWRLLVADAAGGLVFVAVAAWLARPYLKVLELYPYTRRDASVLAIYSAPVSGLFTAPAGSILWGQAHAPARDAMTVPGEMTLLPGFALYALAAAGLVFSLWPLLVRVALGLGALAVLVLSLGTNGPDDGHLGYLMLLRLPGFEGLRTPGRLMLWATLLLALLAAGAVGALVELVHESARDQPDGRPSFRAGLVLLVPVLLIFVEGLGTTPRAPVSPAPPTLSTVAAPYLVLPTDEVGDMPVMLWSTDRFAPMANGGSGIVPTEQEQIRAAARSFPSRDSVAYLRSVGIRSVVVVRSLAGQGAYDQFAGLPTLTAGLIRDVRPDAVVFIL
jgi:hypothetical protein